MHCAKSVPEGNLDQSAPLVRETMTFINNAITKGDRIVPYSHPGGWPKVQSLETEFLRRRV